MTCYTCKQPILENEAYKQVMTACPEAGTGIYQNGIQCTVAHMGIVHVDCPNKSPSKIEQLEKRIEELEEKLEEVHMDAIGYEEYLRRENTTSNRKGVERTHKLWLIE